MRAGRLTANTMTSGAKRIHHPLVGDLDLSYETMELSADTGLTMTIYTADADSPASQALNLLGSWTATPDPADIARLGDEASSR